MIDFKTIKQDGRCLVNDAKRQKPRAKRGRTVSNGNGSGRDAQSSIRQISDGSPHQVHSKLEDGQGRAASWQYII